MPATGAWQLIEIVDYAKTPDYEAYKLSYGRGSITWAWAQGNDAWTFTGAWTEPPVTIAPGQRVEITISVATGTDTGNYYSAGGSFSIRFDEPTGEPGVLINPIGFSNDKGESGTVEVRHTVKTPAVNRKVWAELPAGSPGARKALLVDAFNGRSAGTKYIYEWKAPEPK